MRFRRLLAFRERLAVSVCTIRLVVSVVMA